MGHVIIDIDFDRTIEAFRSLGKSDFHVALDTTQPIFNDFEIGRVSPEEFVQYWLDRIEGSNSKEIVTAWNALLIGIQPYVLKLIQELESSYNLYIYSNTNAIHVEWIMAYLKRVYQINDWVPKPFKAAYYSHELGHRKPDVTGFIKILQEQNLQAEETLFIDDHLPNIQAANQVGIHTIHKRAQADLKDVLDKNEIVA